MSRVAGFSAAMLFAGGLGVCAIIAASAPAVAQDSRPTCPPVVAGVPLSDSSSADEDSLATGVDWLRCGYSDSGDGWRTTGSLVVNWHFEQRGNNIMFGGGRCKDERNLNGDPSVITVPSPDRRVSSDGRWAATIEQPFQQDHTPPDEARAALEEMVSAAALLALPCEGSAGPASPAPQASDDGGGAGAPGETPAAAGAGDEAGPEDAAAIQIFPRGEHMDCANDDWGPFPLIAEPPGGRARPGAESRPLALVRPGDQVAFPPGGVWSVDLPSGSVMHAEGGTLVTIECAERATLRDILRIEVLQGVGLFRWSDPDSELEVRTRHINVGVLGTEFVVDATGDGDAVYVLSGTVSVEHAGDAGGTQRVAAGHWVSATSEGVSQPQAIDAQAVRARFPSMLPETAATGRGVSEMVLIGAGAGLVLLSAGSGAVRRLRRSVRSEA